jgi:hypothetical protein
MFIFQRWKTPLTQLFPYITGPFIYVSICLSSSFDPSVKSTHASDVLLLTELLFLGAPLEPRPAEGTCIWLSYESTDIGQDIGRQPVLSSRRPAAAELEASHSRTQNAKTVCRSHCALGKTRLAGCHSLLDAAGQIIATAATLAALRRTFNLQFSLNNVTHSELSMLLQTNWKCCFKKIVQRF